MNVRDISIYEEKAKSEEFEESSSEEEETDEQRSAKAWKKFKNKVTRKQQPVDHAGWGNQKYVKIVKEGESGSDILEVPTNDEGLLLQLTVTALFEGEGRGFYFWIFNKILSGTSAVTLRVNSSMTWRALLMELQELQQILGVRQMSDLISVKIKMIS